MYLKRWSWSSLICAERAPSHGGEVGEGGGWIYGITWKNVYFNISVLLIVDTTTILKLVFPTAYCFCLESQLSGCVVAIIIVVFAVVIVIVIFIFVSWGLSLLLLLLLLMSSSSSSSSSSSFFCGYCCY